MNNKNLKIAIFIIDDDEHIRKTLSAILNRHGIDNYVMYDNPQSLLEDLYKDVHICVIDYDLKDETFNGVTLMQAIKAKNSWCRCIIMSGYEDAKTIKAFLNNGAFRYLTKGEKDFSNHLISYINKATEEIVDTFKFYEDVLLEITKATDILKTL